MSMRGWLHDVRMILRGVRTAKTFYATAVLTLAVGMAGATVMFTLIRGILLRPLPVPDESQLVVSWRVPPTGPAIHVPYRAADIDAIASDRRVFEGVAGIGYNGAFEVSWQDGAQSFPARTAVVMGDFFAVAGVTPVLGEALSREHDRPGAERAVVLSHAAWQRLLGGRRDVIGRTLDARAHSYRILGVMPEDFAYPPGVEIWTTPIALASGVGIETYRVALLRDIELLARLRPGVTPAQAQAALATVMAALDAAAPAADGGGFTRFAPVVRPYKALVVGDVDRPLLVLFAAVALILVIAAANVANLLLLRGETRRSELVVRAALGASRGRLVALLLSESALVAVAGGLVALLLTTWSLQTVTTLVPGGLPRFEAIHVDPLVLLFTVALALVTAMAAGAMPAVSASRFDLVSQLRAGGRGTIGAASARGRRVLVAAQVALAVTVLSAAGLLGRSLQRLQHADMGFAADQIVFVELDLPRGRYLDKSRPDVSRAFHDALSARVGTAPGIAGVTLLNVLPFAGAAGWELPRFTAEGQSADDVARNASLNFEAVHVSYFSTFGVPILRGRAFTTGDRAEAEPVAIVSDAVAAATWPGQDPIGKRVKFGGVDSRGAWLTVVGVAGTTRYRDLAHPRATLYIPSEQFGPSGGRLAIRTTAAVPFVAGVVADAVRTLDPDVRVLRVDSFAERMREPLAWPRFNALLLGVFAASALALSAVGLYGVMATSVGLRLSEIGVRLALGATAADVRRLVLREGLGLAAAGAAGGLLLALSSMRLLSGLLFDTHPLEPTALIEAALVLVGAAVVATWLPARRATRVDPMTLLRRE